MSKSSKLGSIDPLIPASQSLPELTFKAIVIAILLAIILAASNAYLALKIGTTISASIPASVLALGILRFFKNSNVLESNIIQTAASAGEGIAAAISFVLPAMVVLQVWQGFPYWETTILAMLGGLLGVLFSIPLRRVLLHLPTLRFPEGTAIGNVLRSSSRGGKQLKYLVQGASVGGAVSFFQSGLRVLSDSIQLWTGAGRTLFGLGFGLTSATLAAGYIIGFEVAVSLLLGVIIGWIVVLPLLGLHFGLDPSQSFYDNAMSLWSSHLRFVGVGTMLVGGLWTLMRLMGPVINGLKTSFQMLSENKRSKKSIIERTDKDIPINWVVCFVAVLSILVYGVLFYEMVKANLLSDISGYVMLAGVTLAYILVIGFLLATICGYFTGLVGSTNNPISGVLIMAILLLCLVYLAVFHGNVHGHMIKVVSTVIIVATIIACIASISNENIQDLKAGQMVGATPWKQQLMLAVGVIVATLIIGPVLDLLYNAYGIAGVFPHPGMDHSQMLAAPQASLMAAVAKGVLTHKLEWGTIGIGALVAVAVIIIDEVARRYTNFRFPALAVGLAIYLPPEIMTPIILGGLINYFVKSQHKLTKKTKAEQEVCAQNNHNSVLLACGMVAGSAVMGVVLAIPFVIMGSSNALAIVPAGFEPYANIIGLFVFAALCVWFYRTGIFKKKG